MRELIEHYAWVQRLDVVLTLGVITGRSVSEVVRLYGGDPAESGLMTTGEAEDAGLDDTDGYRYVQVFEQGASVVALENNGWSGTVPEIARRASAGGGRFLSVHWNVNGLFRITEATDGEVVAYFEPTLGTEPAAPDDVIPEWALGMAFEPDQLRATCLALVERQTGVAFERAWFETKLPTYRIPDPDVMLKNARMS